MNNDPFKEIVSLLNQFVTVLIFSDGSCNKIDCFKGRLKAFDEHSNIIMDNALPYSPSIHNTSNTDKSDKIKFIRGDSILAIHAN